MKLYSYFRSSAAYRVRIALALKGLTYETVPIHLLKDGGQQHGAYRQKNPQGLVPALELDDGTLLTQSLAIIEYLEACYPTPRLIPRDPIAAAQVRALSLAIACDIHPLNNLRVLSYLKGTLAQPQSAVDAWYQHWVLEGGLRAVEQQLRPGPFAMGSSPGLADLCLVPQLANARRFAVPLEDLPKCRAVERVCLALPAFQAAAPEQQPDFT